MYSPFGLSPISCLSDQCLMIKFYFLVFLLLAGTCQSVEKADLKDKLYKKDKVRFQIPFSNFAIPSKFSDEFLRLFLVDLETGEILSYGKMKLVSEENLSDQFEKVIEDQLLVAN